MSDASHYKVYYHRFTTYHAIQLQMLDIVTLRWNNNYYKLNQMIAYAQLHTTRHIDLDIITMGADNVYKYLL